MGVKKDWVDMIFVRFMSLVVVKVNCLFRHEREAYPLTACAVLTVCN